MKNKHLKILISLIVLVSVVGLANPTDSVRARLKSGARIRGTIQSSNSSSITINVDGIGDTKFDWSDITFLSSLAVYDSLVGEKAFIVLPTPVSSKSEFGKLISANIFFGYAIKNERGFGFGGQAQFAIEHIFAGFIGMLHIGNASNDISSATNGNTSFYYWGPQLGGIIDFGDFTIKPVISYGQAHFTNINTSNTIDVTAYCFSPGLIVNADLGFTKIGLQYRYFNYDAKKFFGLYLLIGQ